MRCRAALHFVAYLPLSLACQDGAERTPRILPDARQAPTTLRFLDRNLPTGGSEPSLLIDRAAPSAPQDLRPSVDRARTEEEDQRLNADQMTPSLIADRDLPPRDANPMLTLDRAPLGFPCTVSCDCLDGFSCIDGRCQFEEGEPLLFCCSAYCPAGERCESEAGQLRRCPD